MFPYRGSRGNFIANTSLSLLGEPRNAKTSYAEAYNLQVQYQLTSNTIIEAGYVGTVSRHVQVGINTNTSEHDSAALGSSTTN